MIAPAYAPGTSLADILTDGWARGFRVTQTMEEAESMGYEVTEDEIVDSWEHQDEAFKRYLNYDLLKRY